MLSKVLSKDRSLPGSCLTVPPEFLPIIILMSLSPSPSAESSHVLDMSCVFYLSDPLSHREGGVAADIQTRRLSLNGDRFALDT